MLRAPCNSIEWNSDWVTKTPWHQDKISGLKKKRDALMYRQNGGLGWYLPCELLSTNNTTFTTTLTEPLGCVGFFPLRLYILENSYWEGRLNIWLIRLLDQIYFKSLLIVWIYIKIYKFIRLFDKLLQLNSRSLRDSVMSHFCCFFGTEVENKKKVVNK